MREYTVKVVEFRVCSLFFARSALLLSVCEWVNVQNGTHRQYTYTQRRQKGRKEKHM